MVEYPDLSLAKDFFKSQRPNLVLIGKDAFHGEDPEDVIEELGWQEGDILNWDVRGEGIVLSKVNDPSGYEVLDE